MPNVTLSPISAAGFSRQPAALALNIFLLCELILQDYPVGKELGRDRGSSWVVGPHPIPAGSAGKCSGGWDWMGVLVPWDYQEGGER